MVPSDVWILFPMANALLNAVFISSREKVVGSLESGVQVKTAGPPEVRLLGMEPKVRADTNGRKKMMLKAECIVCE
jgi:hypothetical protein